MQVSVFPAKDGCDVFRATEYGTVRISSGLLRFSVHIQKDDITRVKAKRSLDKKEMDDEEVNSLTVVLQKRMRRIEICDTPEKRKKEI